MCRVGTARGNPSRTRRCAAGPRVQLGSPRAVPSLHTSHGLPRTSSSRCALRRYERAAARSGNFRNRRAGECRHRGQDECVSEPRARNPASARLRSLLALPLLREDSILDIIVGDRDKVGGIRSEGRRSPEGVCDAVALAIRQWGSFREIKTKSGEIETANRHKSEFITNMSHELRRRSTRSSVSPRCWPSGDVGESRQAGRSKWPTFSNHEYRSRSSTTSSISPRSRRDAWELKSRATWTPRRSSRTR